MTTLPDPNNPQPGDRFTGGSGKTFTVRYVGKERVFVEYDGGTELSWALSGVINNCTPVPPPTPGPDEIYARISSAGSIVFTSTSPDAQLGQPFAAFAHVVRYVKADPQ